MSIRISNKVIGNGTFAKVYLAQNTSTNEFVAVKSIDKRKLGQKLMSALKNEIEMMRKIDNVNIIKLFDILETQDTMSLVMEYCNLGDLSMFIERYRNRNSLDGIPMFYVYSFLSQLTSSLQVMRQLNLVHRDLKPHNILLTTGNANENSIPMGGNVSSYRHVTLKLGDFGFAKILDGDEMAETLCGSPLYMAPEILRYEKYDAKADLWSVGIILYEMITGRVPFKAKNHIALLKKIQSTKKVLFPDEAPERNNVSLMNARASNPISIPQASSWNPGQDSMTIRSRIAGSANEVPTGLRDLTRSLLKKDPVERIGFEEFFLRLQSSHITTAGDTPFTNSGGTSSRSTYSNANSRTYSNKQSPSFQSTPPIFNSYTYRNVYNSKMINGISKNQSPVSNLSISFKNSTTTTHNDHSATGNEEKAESVGSFSHNEPFVMEGFEESQKRQERKPPSLASSRGRRHTTAHLILPFANVSITSSSASSSGNNNCYTFAGEEYEEQVVDREEEDYVVLCKVKSLKR